MEELPPSASTEANTAPTPTGIKPTGLRLRSTSVDRRREHRPRQPSSTRIRVGVCARDKKAHSKPMKQILSRFDSRIFDIVVFGDEVILNQPIERWPVVDCLMSWYSSGFPLEKAEAYIKLRKPFAVNDLATEFVLRDRRRFYAVLQHHGIPTPNRVVVERDVPGKESVVIETEDAIEVDGKKILKPFVEKPVDAEDHNIYIYYPRRLGGGSKRLFRKVGNTSSKFYPDVSNIRTEGSYIYEEFLMTQGTDIKIYVVGPDYAHAEARKSPVVDGIVQRDAEGKEVRYPIMLTHKEKDVARRVCLAFRQNVCGFDLLRTPGSSFVCDVNGWSFVKKSHKYYDDAAQLLQLMMIRAVAPDRIHSSILLHTSPPAGLTNKFLGSNEQTVKAAKESALRSPSMSKVNTSMAAFYSEVPDDKAEATGSTEYEGSPGSTAEEELRCVAAIIRHGDRTPKQKMKMVVTHPAFLKLHKAFAKRIRDEAKLKSAQQLQAALEVTRELIAARQPGGTRSSLRVASADIEHDAESLDKLMQMKEVLEKGGHFSGINRKIQLKPTKWISKGSAVSKSELRSSAPCALPPKSTSSISHRREIEAQIQQEVWALQRASKDHPMTDFDLIDVESLVESGGNEVSADSGEEAEDVEVTECLLVLKWGGVLTHAGKQQAELLGQRFRSVMYPGESVGLLRLHSTYRHDLKIYSSDEGRVQMTAAAFVKGFLDLEGELTPILASLVKTVNTANLLDDSVAAREIIDSLKRRLTLALTADVVPVDKPGADQPTEIKATAKGATSPCRQPVISLPSQDELARLEAAIDEALLPLIAPTKPAAILRAISQIGLQPKTTLHRIHSLIGALVSQLQLKLETQRSGVTTGLLLEEAGTSIDDDDSAPARHHRHNDSEIDRMVRSQYSDPSPGGSEKAVMAMAHSVSGPDLRRLEMMQEESCNGESLWLMSERWKKLHKDFYKPKKDAFDLSKIPDIYDQVKYDCLHNGFLNLQGLEELYELSKSFADVVVSQEYGITVQEKKDIAARICHHLLRKIFFDMTAVAVEDSISLDETDPPGVPAEPNVEAPVPLVTPSPQAASTRSSHPDPSPPCENTVVPGHHNIVSVDVTSMLQEIPNTDGADDMMRAAVAGDDGCNEFISPLSGLVVTLRQHSFSARLRRKSSPSVLSLGLHKVSRLDDSQVHVNPAIGPRVQLDAIDRSWKPLSNYASLPKPVPLQRGASASPEYSCECPASTSSRAKHKAGCALAAEDDASEMGSTVSGYDRAPNGPVLVPSFRVRQRNAAGPSPCATTGMGAASVDSDSVFSPAARVPESYEAPKDSGGPPMIDTAVDVHGAKVAGDAEPPIFSEKVREGGDVSMSSDTPTGSASVQSKISTIMAAIAKDFHDVTETVHQLDARIMTDAGYDEVKTLSRHVRTRLYFTSESHVQALINTVKYWAFGAEDEKNQATRLTTPASLGMLEATPELDYLTHIVFRLYENFHFPPGHPKRHRIEVLFSPGASFSPFTGLPREPRVVPAKAADYGNSASALSLDKLTPMEGRRRSVSGSNTSDDIALTLERFDLAAETPSADGTAQERDRFSMYSPYDPEAFEADEVLESASSVSEYKSKGIRASRFQVPEVRPPSSTVYAGPTRGSTADLDAHTLPVAGVVPINLSLTLDEFEDVLAEAIYYGAQLHLSDASEQHPKDEAKARAAAARARKAASDSYFVR